MLGALDVLGRGALGRGLCGRLLGHGRRVLHRESAEGKLAEARNV